MSARLLVLLFALGALGALGTSACGDTGTGTVTEYVGGVNLSGSVRTTNGDAVVGATLFVELKSPVTCATTVYATRLTSDSTGSFSASLFAFGQPSKLCVWIAVVPPAASSAAADTVTYPSRPDGEQTVEANIVLALRPAP